MMSKRERNNNEKINLKRMKISFWIVEPNSAERCFNNLMAPLKSCGM